MGLALTCAGSWWMHIEIESDARAEFERGANRIEDEVARRFRQPIYGLNGAKGVYAASARVERAEFKAYVNSLRVLTEFPGVRDLGFIQSVKRKDLATFVAAERKDEAPDFKMISLAETERDEL